MFPHTQFLSNGNYVTSVTNAGGGASTWRGLPVTRWRRDATRDADGQFIYLRDVRSGAVWSAAYQPTRREPDDYAVDVLAPTGRRFRRRDEDISTQLDIAVSTEDDVEVRRITIRNHGHAHPRARRHELRGDRPRARRRPIWPTRRSASCSSRPSIWRTAPRCSAIAGRASPASRRPGRSMSLSLDGRPQGPLEWETDRARFLGRGRSPADPAALDGRALSGTTGIVLDPIVSLRQRIRLPPGATVRLCFATGMASDRETVEALARKYHEPARRRAHVRAGAHPRRKRPSPSRHLARRGAAVRAARLARARHGRLAAGGGRRRSPRTSSASPGCGRTPSPAICRSCSSA